MIGTSIIGNTFTVGGAPEETTDYTLVAESLALTLAGSEPIFGTLPLIGDTLALNLGFSDANITGSSGNSGPLTGLEIVVLKSRLSSNITLRSRL